MEAGQAVSLAAAWHRAARNRARAIRGMRGKIAQACLDRDNYRTRLGEVEAELARLRAVLNATDAQEDLEIALERAETAERKVIDQRRAFHNVEQTTAELRAHLRSAFRFRGEHANNCVAWKMRGGCDCYRRMAVRCANTARPKGQPRAPA